VNNQLIFAFHYAVVFWLFKRVGIVRATLFLLPFLFLFAQIISSLLFLISINISIPNGVIWPEKNKLYRY